MRENFFECDFSDLDAVLSELRVVGQPRHLLFELILVRNHREWDRPDSEDYIADRLDLSVDDTRNLVRKCVSENLVDASQDIRSGQFSGISLSNEISKRLRAALQSAEEAYRSHQTKFRGPRPPTEGVKKRTHRMFDETCELCGDVAHRGKDRFGRDMRVAKIKKELDGAPNNVTLLCSQCSTQMTKRDLPAEVRSLEMLEISDQRQYERPERSAKIPEKPLKEIVVLASGPVSVKTRTIDEGS